MSDLAIRTVSETDDIHVIEGLIAYGGPFRGRDSYQTFFSVRTDWALDLHPEGVPILMEHGFDPDFGLSPIGRSMPTASFRTDADGMWVQAQLDKRHRYYATRVLPLLEASGVGLSQGSSEHSIRFDPLTREALVWPLQEISLTSTESNPWNVIAARSAEFVETIRIVSGEESPAVPAVRAASGDVYLATGLQASLATLMDCESGEADQFAELRTAFDAVGRFIALESTEIGTPEDADAPGHAGWPAPTDSAYMSAIRAGRRNASSDQALIDTIHNASATLGATAHAAPDGQPNDDTPPTEAPDDAARSGDPVPLVTITTEPEDPAAVRERLLAHAVEVGTRTALEALKR